MYVYVFALLLLFQALILFLSNIRCFIITNHTISNCILKAKTIIAKGISQNFWSGILYSGIQWILYKSFAESLLLFPKIWTTCYILMILLHFIFYFYCITKKVKSYSIFISVAQQTLLFSMGQLQASSHKRYSCKPSPHQNLAT